MSKVVWKRRLALVFWGAMVTAYSAMAAGVVIDVMKNGYGDLGLVQAVTVDTPDLQRSLAASQVAAIQRSRSDAPFATLQPGSTMKVLWPDGSSEYVMIVDPSRSDGVQPIAGTLRDGAGRAVAPKPVMDEDAAESSELPASARQGRLIEQVD